MADYEFGPFTIGTGQTISADSYYDNYPGILVFQARPVASVDGDLSFASRGRLQISDVSFEWRPREGWEYHYYFQIKSISGFGPITYMILANRA